MFFLIDRKSFANINYLILISVLLLCLIGIASIYSATYQNKNNDFYLRQIFFIFIGLLGMFFIIQMDYYYLKIGIFVISFYILCFGFLVILLFFGKKTAQVTRWLNFGFFTFQPSELAKLGLIILLAKLLENKAGNLDDLKTIFIPFIATLIPVMLIILQPDIGTSLVFFFIFFSMLFWAGWKLIYIFILTIILPISAILGYYILIKLNQNIINFQLKNLFAISGFIILFLLFFLIIYTFIYYSKIKKKEFIFILLIIFLIAISSPIFWNNLKDYQKIRIITFLKPNSDPLGAGYNVIQSKIALGSGKLIGKGWLKGTQIQLGFLPVQHTDFIFSGIAEEWGFFGTFIILFLYFIIILNCIKIAYKSEDMFGSLLVIGITFCFLFHIVVNIGMTCGIMPVTGIPLPWISYGGTSVIINLLSIGLVLNVGARNKRF